MIQGFEKYKGIHPGPVIDRELRKRHLSQRPFALSLPEHPQSFNAVLKGKRNLTTSLALKVERALGLEEGALLMLQMFYDIQQEKRKEALQHYPDLTLLRRGLFWDTDINTIDWNRYGRAVIERVFERGDEAEKKEITRFYGLEKVKEVLGKGSISY